MRRYKFWVRIRGFMVEVFISADGLGDALLIAEAQYGKENIHTWTTVDDETVP